MRRFVVMLAILTSLLSTSAFVMPSAVSAALPATCNGSVLGLPVWYKYLTLNDECEIIGPMETGDDGVERFDWQGASGYIAIAVVEVLLRIASLVAVGFVMYGGFRFIMSQGDPEGSKAARETIINALIGVVVAIAAASIVSFLAGRLTS